MRLILVYVFLASIIFFELCFMIILLCIPVSSICFIFYSWSILYFCCSVLIYIKILYKDAMHNENETYIEENCQQRAHLYLKIFCSLTPPVWLLNFYYFCCCVAFIFIFFFFFRRLFTIIYIIVDRLICLYFICKDSLNF